MTGNLTQFTIDLVELVVPLRGRAGRTVQLRAAVKRRLLKFGVPLTGFVLGALLGGWLTGIWGLCSIAIPAACVGGLTVVTWRNERTHPAS
jgi:uncharacterized membrane protein YoaK (UPF0700 family)